MANCSRCLPQSTCASGASLPPRRAVVAVPPKQQQQQQLLLLSRQQVQSSLMLAQPPHRATKGVQCQSARRPDQNFIYNEGGHDTERQRPYVGPDDAAAIAPHSSQTMPHSATTAGAAADPAAEASGDRGISDLVRDWKDNSDRLVESSFTCSATACDVCRSDDH